MRFKSSYPSIRAALVLVVLLALVPALAIIIWTGLEHGTMMAERTRAEAERQVEAFANLQERISETARQTLTTLAALPEFVNGDFRSMDGILKAVHANNQEYLNFTAVDLDCKVTASSRLERGFDLSGRLHLKEAIEGKRFAAGEYIIAAVDAEPSFPFAYPILDADGAVSGAVAATYKLASYAALFERFKLPPESTLGLVDRNGTRIFFYPPKETNPLGGKIKESIWEGIRSVADAGVLTDKGPDGIERFYAFRAIGPGRGPEPYLYVVYAAPTSIARDANRAILIRNLLLMAFVAAIGLLTAASVSGFLFGQRLDSIIQTTARISEGMRGIRTGLADDSSDLGQIAKALDSMAETIERRDAERDEYARKLAASLAGKDILLKEIHHRVKNNLQLILSLIRLQSDTGQDPRGFSGTMENRILSMALVHEMLYETENDGGVELGSYAERILDLIGRSNEGTAGADARVEADPISVNLVKAVPFGLLVNELATNAFKHALKPGKRGSLLVSLKRSNGTAVLEVLDDGPGLPPGFDLSAAHGLGLGLHLAEALATQLGGILQCDSPGGARFRVEFPVSG